MRRLALVTLLVATATALFLAAPATASANSCSTTSAGGEKTPSIDNLNGNVNETGTQGYKCTVTWFVTIFPQYESGGTWHNYVTDTNGTPGAPGFHPAAAGGVAANTGYNWPHLSGGHVVDGDITFGVGAGPAPDVPVCSVNWRLQLSFAPYPQGFVFANDVSPELHKSC